MTGWETRTERDVDVRTNEPVVRIFYRRPGARRWRKTLVVVGPGLTPEEVEDRAEEIAEHLAGDGS